MTPSVYLAGPITGLTFEDGNDWRVKVEEELWECGILAYSPLRAKDYLSGIGVLEKQYHGLNVLSDAKGITTRDRFDVTTRDLLLVNFENTERVSIGTVMEIAWADAARKPIVLAMPDGDLHDHDMIRQSVGFIVPTLEEAVHVTKAILLTNQERKMWGEF